MGKGIESVIRSYCKIKALPARIFLAEFLGTTVLVSFGCGGAAQLILSNGSDGSPMTSYMAWGLGYTFGLYLAGGVSGGHLNPAVTLSNCILGRTRWVFFLLYIVAQYLGAFTGAALVYGMYIDAINNFHFEADKTMETAPIFSTYPRPWLSSGNAILDTICSTSLLLMLWLAIIDKNNMGPNKGLTPIAIGLVVTALGMTFGHNCQFPLNPARDLSPRLFSFIAGWPDNVFELRDHDWWWIPSAMPYVGAFVGCLLYLLFIGAHIDEDDDDNSLADHHSIISLKKKQNHTERTNKYLEEDTESYHRNEGLVTDYPRFNDPRQNGYGTNHQQHSPTRSTTIPRASYRNSAFETEIPSLYYPSENTARF